MINMYDGFLSLLSVLGLWPAFERLYSLANPTQIEKKVRDVLGILILLQIVRAPVIGWGLYDYFGPVTYFLACLLSVSVALSFETLLRRHFPLWFKFFIVIGNLFAFITILTGKLPYDKGHVEVFFYVQLLVVLAVFGFCLLRNRKDYSNVENNLINLSMLSFLFMGVAMLTDLHLKMFEGVPRLGALGAVLFGYFSIYNKSLHEDHPILKELFKSLVYSIILTLVIVRLFPTHSTQLIVRHLSFFLIINFTFRSWYLAKELSNQGELANFVTQLTEASKTSTRKFLYELGSAFNYMDWYSLRNKDLAGYDVDALHSTFKKENTHLFYYFDLKRKLDQLKTIDHQEDELEIQAFEQMIDLMDKHNSNYICKFGVTDPMMILFNIPIIGYSNLMETQTRLIAQTTELIEQSKS